MEFLDEESKPRFVFQSRAIPSSKNQENPNNSIKSLHKPTIFLSLFLSSIFLSLSLLYFQSEPLQSLFFWLSFSFFLGPFAPISLTAGHISVGLGPPLPPPPPQDNLPQNPISTNRRSKPKKDQDSTFSSTPFVKNENGEKPTKDVAKNENSPSVAVVEEREWSDGDLEMLKKQMGKNPVGKPGRWEAIAEAFNGRHGVESVIRTAKSLGEKRVSDSDSFDRFLKDRKPVDKRVEEEIGNVEMKESSWSSGEDIALLNALKAFPKEVAMRWEKIAAAVPGKSKAACMKRVAELKRDFRSSKVSSNDA